MSAMQKRALFIDSLRMRRLCKRMVGAAIVAGGIAVQVPQVVHYFNSSFSKRCFVIDDACGPHDSHGVSAR